MCTCTGAISSGLLAAIITTLRAHILVAAASITLRAAAAGSRRRARQPGTTKAKAAPAVLSVLWRVVCKPAGRTQQLPDAH